METFLAILITLMVTTTGQVYQENQVLKQDVKELKQEVIDQKFELKIHELKEEYKDASSSRTSTKNH